MLIPNRLRKIKNFVGTLFLFLLIAIIISFCVKQKSNNNGDISTNATAQNYKRIVIDAGHGGVDPGAVGVGGIAEKNINLQISLYLRDILTLNGYEVIMTRESDIAINDPIYHTIKKIKTSDIKNRLKIIDRHSDSIAVSVHQNHYPSEASNGAQMFYGRKNEDSKLIAQSIQDAFRANLQPDNSRQIKKSTSSVYIIHNAKNPIVLVECGFISNYDEAKKLVDDEYQKQVAFTIFSGIDMAI